MERLAENDKQKQRFHIESIYEDAWQTVFRKRLYSIYGNLDNTEILAEDLTGESYERLVRHFSNDGFVGDDRPEVSGGFILRVFETTAVDHFRKINGHYRPRKWLVDLVGKSTANFLYKHACEKHLPEKEIVEKFLSGPSKEASSTSEHGCISKANLQNALAQMRKNDECGRRDQARLVEGDAPHGRTDSDGVTFLELVADTSPTPDQTVEKEELASLLEQLLSSANQGKTVVPDLAGASALLHEEEKLCLRIRLEAHLAIDDVRFSEAKLANLANMAVHTYRRRCQSGVDKITQWIEKTSG